jgi:hypothetical protein
VPDESDHGSIVQAIDDLELPIDNEEEQDKLSVGQAIDKVLGRQVSSMKPLSSF